MKKFALSLSLLATLAATPALAITRTIECDATRSGDKHLTIQLRAGLAYLFACESAPCRHLDADAIAELKTDSNLEYNVTSSKLDFAQKSLRVEFADQPGGPVSVWLDGDLSRYTNCY